MQCLRGAGCSINDLTDRDLDRQVERTRYRPLAAGVLDTRQAVAFIGVQLAFGSLVWLQLNTYSKLLALSSLALVVAYPRMKRITSWVRSVRSLSALVPVAFAALVLVRISDRLPASRMRIACCLCKAHSSPLHACSRKRSWASQ